MELGAVQESLGKLSRAQLAQLRNHLLSQDVASIGLSADQAMGLLQAIEELDSRDVQPNFPPSQSGPGFPVPQQQPVDVDMPKVINNINRLFMSAFGNQGGADNSMVYQPNSELSAINERVQMLEMQRARILSAQKQEQQLIQSAIGDGGASWTGPSPKRRMMSNDEANFNEVQGFQGNWMQGGNQNSQMNQSTGQMNQSAVQMNQPRAQVNQSGGRPEMNQSRDGAKMNQSRGGAKMNQSRGRAKMNRGGFAQTNKQSRGRRRGRPRLRRVRGGQQWRSPGRSEPRDGSYGRRSPDDKDYNDRRSRSRESVGRDRRDNSNDRGHSYNRRSHDGDQRDDQGYQRGRSEGSRSRDRDSHERRHHEQDDGYGRRSNDDDDDNRSYQGEGSYQDDGRSHQDEGRSYQGESRSYRDESRPYPESPRGDGYFRSEPNDDFTQDDQFDDRGDRHDRKRKHRDFDEGSWHADDRHDPEPPRRYSPERDYPDQRFSDVDQPRRGDSHYQEPPFDYVTERGRSRERDERRWDDGPEKDILDTPVGMEERWHNRKLSRSGDREHGPGFLQQGEVLISDLAQARYRAAADELLRNPPERRGLNLDLDLGRIQPIPLSDELLRNPPERRSLDLDLGRIKPIPLSIALGGQRHLLNNQPLAHRLGAQVPRDGFKRGFSGPATMPSKEAPVSARMQGFPKRNQSNLIKTTRSNFSLSRTVYQTKGDIALVNLLLKSGIPDMMPINKPDLQNTKAADVKEAAGSVPAAGTPTTDQNKGNSKDVQAVSRGGNVAGKTLSKKPRPKPLKPEANSIGSQCDILESLELQGFLYHRVMTLWTCYICRTSLKNGGAYRIHLLSKHHARTYNALQTYEGVFDRRKIAFALRNLPNHRTVTPEQLSAGSVNRMYFCCECGEGYSCEVLEHRKTERHLALALYRKCCYLCNVYCSDGKALTKHQNSKLHITMKAIKKKDILTKEEVQASGDVQNKVYSRTFVPSKVPSKVPVSTQKPFSSKSSDSSKTPVSNKASFPTKKPITSRATAAKKSSTLTKELSSDLTDDTAQQNISGVRSERKSIKVTLKGSSKKDSKVGEESEELIGLDLVIPVTGFFCRCCSKFYNNKHMAERNHCMTVEHKQKALAWFKTHGKPNLQKKPGASSEREAKSKPQKPVCPQPKPTQSETIIVIDDDDDCDDVNGTSKEKQQPPQLQDEMDTGDSQVTTTQARLSDKADVTTKLSDSKLTPGAVNSKEDNGQVPGHAEKGNEGSKIAEVDVKEKHQPTTRPVGRKLLAVPAQHKSSKGSDLEDGEIVSEGELSANEQSGASMGKMEAETVEQPRDETEDLPAKTMESGAVGETVEGAVDPPAETMESGAVGKMETETTKQPRDKTEDLPAKTMESGAVCETKEGGAVGETVEGALDPTSAEMEVEATDETVQECREPSSETMEVVTEEQAVDETEELLTSRGTDQNVNESVESHTEETAKPVTDLSVEVTDTTTSETDNMDVDQSVEIREEPPIREMEEASDGPNSDMTTEPPNMELDSETTDLTVSGNAEPSFGETETAQAEGNLPSGGVPDPKETEQAKEDVAETLVAADKNIDLAEDDLYADLVEHAPEAEMEECLDSGEEQGNEEDVEEEEDEEDTRFFIDEGTWEVRSEEDGSNEDPLEDGGTLEVDDDELDDDELIVIEDEEDTNKDVEEQDNDTAS